MRTQAALHEVYEDILNFIDEALSNRSLSDDSFMALDDVSLQLKLWKADLNWVDDVELKKMLGLEACQEIFSNLTLILRHLKQEQLNIDYIENVANIVTATGDQFLPSYGMGDDRFEGYHEVELDEKVVQSANTTHQTTRSFGSDTVIGAHRENYLEPDAYSLRECIEDILSQNTLGVNPHGKYLPQQAYSDLFTSITIQQALGGSRVKLKRTSITFILDQAKKTFAALMLTFSSCDERYAAFSTFEDGNFTDEQLPSRTIAICQKHPCKKTDQNGIICKHQFPYHAPWDTSSLETFKSKRWHFLVEKVEKQKFIYEVDYEQLLPLKMTKSAEVSRSGYFSTVTHAKMLASMQDTIISSEDYVDVALKSLTSISDPDYDIEKAWRQEAEAHKDLNGMREHMVRAIAAYRQVGIHEIPDTYHIVLEWANGGNLRGFWQEHPEPQLDARNIELSRMRVRMMLEQMYGLSAAIEGMHNNKLSSTSQGEENSNEPSPALSPMWNIDPRVNTTDSPPSAPKNDQLPIVVINDGDDQVPEVMPLLQGNNDSEALRQRNRTMGTSNWRHGDIKPENILRFTESDTDAWLGTLKLADLGRAKQNVYETKKRWYTKTEEEFWRTKWYEPPDFVRMEEHADGHKVISRLVDIWSIGCVILETVLWLLYGTVVSQDFLNTSNLATGRETATPYWIQDHNNATVFKVSDMVTNWMNNIIDNDPEGTGAIGDLVKLVRDRLLKIDLPTHSEMYSEGCRTNASDLIKQLCTIIDRASNDPTYLFSGQDRSGAVPPSTHMQVAQGRSRLARSHNTFRRRTRSWRNTGNRSSMQRAYYKYKDHSRPARMTLFEHPKTYLKSREDKWNSDDTLFATILSGRYFYLEKPDLCRDCQLIDITNTPTISFDLKKIQMNTDNADCDLCEVVSEAVQALGVESIDLVRQDNNFVLKENGMKVLRLCRISEPVKGKDDDIPSGAPTLCTPTGVDPNIIQLESFIKLPKAWLQDCDKNHASCTPNHGPRVLPKRLIDLRKPDRPKIVDTKDAQLVAGTTLYVALSHNWGVPEAKKTMERPDAYMPEMAKSTPENINQRLKGMAVDQLPLSFCNAIAITASLGCRYLWIDTLCILQGSNGDSSEQADKMQSTFSNAYCVLAACSAEGAQEGFLQDREPRYVKMGEVFVSAVTNDFERDVLQSTLNSRGWVLQERAFARRTIFFTNMQMYWECGDGIRCETMTKLKNDEIAFLGDANFPDYTIRQGSTVGDQVELVTDLFHRYSKLGFSHPEDRPVAIDGIMSRLTEAFKTQSLAGIFQTFWGRCLLWRRAEGVAALRKIPPGPHTKRTPPSWSWMAYEGVIDFLKPPGRQVDWNDEQIKLPFEDTSQASWLKTSHRTDSVAIYAKAYAYVAPTDGNGMGAHIYWDGDEALSNTETKCVIIGSKKWQTCDTGDQPHYVLIVKAKSAEAGMPSYERVGVGTFPRKLITLVTGSVSIMID